MIWNKFPGNRLPKERRYVLLQLNGTDYSSASVVVGYLKYAAGDKKSPQFIMPGVSIERTGTERTVTHWCDCLGDDFVAPLWSRGQI